MRLLLLSLAALAMFAVIDATPAQAMRCGTRLVREGDTPSQVRERCGEPNEVTTTTETRSRTVHRRISGVIVSDTISVEVRVVQWVYNFGPQRFMRRLVFEDDLLVDIEELGRGR